MDYLEHPVPAILHRHVQCVWQLRDDAPSSRTHTIYPDGRCELIVHRGAPMRLLQEGLGWTLQARALCSGQLRSAIRLQASGTVDCIGVRLQPAASHAIAALALPGLVDRIVALDSLDAVFARQLIDACRVIEQAPAAALWPALASRLAPVGIDACVERAVAVIDAAHGDVAIAVLCRALGISPRGLQTRFLAAVGMTCKEYARVRRLQGTLRALDAEAGPLAAVAIEAGFADQAHATRELHRLTGLTPSRLRRSLKAERDGDATLQMAAAFVRGRSGP